MKGYVLHFLVYILAMSGLIATALIVYKKIMTGSLNSKTGNSLKIEETLNINPRKSLMVVKAGNERFLIASDVDKTTLISKLNADENLVNNSLKRFENTEYIPPMEPKSNITGTNNYKAVEQDKSIHLDVINSHNPDITVLRKRRNTYTSRNHRKTAEIEVGTSSNHGFSTIKEIAAKVNEL